MLQDIEGFRCFFPISKDNRQLSVLKRCARTQNEGRSWDTNSGCIYKPLSNCWSNYGPDGAETCNDVTLVPIGESSELKAMVELALDWANIFCYSARDKGLMKTIEPWIDKGST